MSNAVSIARFKCLFFGMPCAFSSPILSALDRPDIELVGVVTPQMAPDREPFRVIRGFRSQPVIALSGHSRQFQAPRYLVRDIGNERLRAELRDMQPDVIVVACFPWLIPEALTSVARIAAINIHPSLLPRHRGPDPLFWTFRAGESIAGVTLHLLSDTFDEGSILTQSTTMVEVDESLAALEQRLARLGVGLLAELLSDLPALPAGTPQDNLAATSEPAPGRADRSIDPAWTVARARRFIAGVGRSHGPLSYRSEGDAHQVIGLATGSAGVAITFRDGRLRVATA